MNKKDIKKKLMEEYGYSEDDLKQDNGRELIKSDMEKILESEESKKDKTPKEPEKVEVVEDVPEVEEVPEIEEEPEEKSFFDQGIKESTARKFKDGDEISVMSGINGRFIHMTPSGKEYVYGGFGQIREMRYEDVRSLRELYRSVLDDGWLVILNKDLIDEYGYQDMYDNVLTPHNINQVFKMSPTELNNFIDKLPRGMKTTLVDRAREMVKENQLDSLGVITTIEEKMDISLKDNLPKSEYVKLTER